MTKLERDRAYTDACTILGDSYVKAELHKELIAKRLQRALEILKTETEEDKNEAQGNQSLT